MEQIRQTLLDVFNDIEFRSLHPDVCTKVEEAIRRVEIISVAIGGLVSRKKLLDIEAAKKGIWLKEPQSVWLTRESDFYDSKTCSGRFTNDPSDGIKSKPRSYSY